MLHPLDQLKPEKAAVKDSEVTAQIVSLALLAASVYALFRKNETEAAAIPQAANPVPPASVAKEAEEGLRLRKSVPKSKRGGTAVGLARAKQLSNRENISDKTVKRMKSFLARHKIDKKAQGFRRGEKGYPSKGLQAWKLWGGDSAAKWLKKGKSK